MLRWIKALVFVSAVVAPTAAYAQASIVGAIRDTSGAVLPGVTVEASSPALIEKTRSGDTVANVPSSRQYFAYTQLVPAINAQGNDVGGALGPIFSVFQVHGGRRNEGQVLVDGQSAGFQGMGVSSYVPEVANQEEVTFSISGGLGEAVNGG